MTENNRHKTLWCTPYCRGSEISRFSQKIVETWIEKPDRYVALGINRHHEKFPSTNGHFYLDDDTDPTLIENLFDSCILNIGNNVPNHADIFKLLRRFPSVVVMHDHVYQHVIANYCYRVLHSPVLYGFLMCELYGEEALAVLVRSGICSRDVSNRAYSPWDSADAMRFPMSEMFINLASAVITHSDYSANYVKSFFKGPVLRSQLPSDMKPAIAPEAIAAWQGRIERADKINIASFGYIAKHKCLDRLMKVIAASREMRKRVVFYIVGFPGDEKYVARLHSMVCEYRLEDTVRFEFSVSDDRLQEIKELADIFYNVRMPNTEGGSSSLVEQMNTGKPVIVAHSGCYAEIPDDAAVKVSLDDKDVDVADQLLALLRDPRRLVEMGTRGKEFIQQVDTEVYIQKLEAFLAEHAQQINDASLGIRDGDISAHGAHDPRQQGLAFARALWETMDTDPFIYGPHIFENWDHRLLAKFICSILLDEAHNKTLLTFVEERLETDRQRFYGDLCDFRTVFDSILDGQGGQEGLENAQRITAERSELLWEFSERLSTRKFLPLAYYLLFGQKLSRAAADDLEMDRGAVLQWVSEAVLDGSLSAAAGERIKDLVGQDLSRDLGGARLPYDRSVTFSAENPESADYLRGGWHPLGPAGVWSVGNSGRLLFVPGDSAAENSRRIRLDITGRLAATQQVGEVSLSIRVNGTERKRVSVATDSTMSLAIEVDRESCETGVLVGFELDKQINLKALGISKDDRTLGFFLQAFSISAAAGESADWEEPDVIRTFQARRWTRKLWRVLRHAAATIFG